MEHSKGLGSRTRQGMGGASQQHDAVSAVSPTQGLSCLLADPGHLLSSGAKGETGVRPATAHAHQSASLVLKELRSHRWRRQLPKSMRRKLS